MIVLKKIQLLFDRDSFFSLGNSFFHKGDRRKKIPGKIFLLLAGIVVYFIVLQLCLRHYEPGIERDSVAILNQTAAWHRTGVYVAEDQTGKFVPPLALYIFRLPLVLNLPLESGILFLILLFGTSVPVLSFLIAREWCLDDKVSLVFAALMASNPYLQPWKKQC